MINVLFGCLGALSVLLLVGVGAALGWRFRGKFEELNKTEPAPRASEAERKALIEQQKAFQKMMGYTIEDAYGPEPKDGDT